MQVGGSLDTNVILRFMLRDIEDQYLKAKRLIESESIFYVADICLAELGFVLERYYGLSRADIKLTLEFLVHIDNLKFSRELLTSSLSYFIEYPALSLEDCLLVAQAKINKAEPLFTFDKKLARQLKSARHLD